MPDKKENRTISDNLVYCQNNNCYVRLRAKSAIYIKRESVNGRGYIKNIKRKKTSATALSLRKYDKFRRYSPEILQSEKSQGKFVLNANQ